MIPTSIGDEVLSLDASLQQAAGHHRAGRLREAEQLYRSILKIRPNYPDVNHNLGVLLGQAGQHASGLPHLKAALEADPTQGDYWLSYADALLACGQAEDALTVIQTAMQHGLDTPATLSLRDKVEAAARNGYATNSVEIPPKIVQPQEKSPPPLESLPQAERERLAALFNAGRHAELEKEARRLIERHPDSGFAWKMLSIALHFQGKNGLSAFQKVTELLPDDADGHCSLSNALRVIGRLDEAVASCQRALAIKPEFAEAYYNLGNAQRDLGRLENAATSYRSALEIKPDYVEAHNNLGNVLNDLGQRDIALASYRSALAIKPDCAEALYNQGNALKDLGQFNEAVTNYRRALEITPDFADAHNNLGNALLSLGKPVDAVASFRRALEIKSDYADAYSNLLYALNFHPEKSGEEILAACREYDKRFGLPHRGKWLTYCNSRDAGRILRIGYVSPDFRRHAVAIFAEPILANHDKSQVEIFCYAVVKREDEYTERFRQYADHWHSIVGLSDDAAAQMIRDHQIDILVDLAGHTGGNRLQVFARKPAPIQLTYLGYPGSTGLSAMDYRITDRYADAEGTADAFYVERLLRLPNSLCCYRPAGNMPETSSLPALSCGYLTFGSFNNYNKIDDACLALWAELLRALPAARLIMLTVPEGETRLHLTRRFAELGIEAPRLEFHGKLPAAEFYRKFLEVDIALDPISVSGGTTTCESLWMGVPVIALVGGRFITRVSYSFLSTAGFADFAAASPKDYIRIAVHLARDLPLLAEIRAGLRDHLATTPLTDEVGFTRNLEKLYREIWGRWCKDGTQGGNGKELHGQTAQPQTGAEGVIPSELPKAGKTATYQPSENLDSLPQRDRLIALFNTGRYREVESLARLACEHFPDSGFAWKALGVALQAQGKNALAALQKATELLPDDADAHNSLGVALESLGRFDDAVASCRQALEIAPGLAEAHSNLGNALHGLGRFNEAVASYHRALEIKPDYAEAHCNLAATLKDSGQLDEALAACLRALEIKPDYAEAHFNLGVVLQSLGQPDNALACYRRTLELMPGFAEAHNNLGYSLLVLGNPVDAVASFRRAMEIKPDYAEANSNLLYALNFNPDISREAILAVCREYDERFGLPRQWSSHGNNRDAGRTLRVAYVSPDFRQHAVAIFAEPILSNHDKSQVEIFCYAEVKREDECTARFRRYADYWHSTVGVSDDAVAQMIREHQIDILVDLAGHTKGNRLQVFARKPAPIQITYLGYPGSTGLSAVDYRITDRYADPEGEADAFYVERLLRLPDSLCCYRPVGNMPETSPLPALSRGYLTFGSFNNYYKIDRRTLVLWAELLRALPAARLMILTVPEGETRLRLARCFAELGVDAERLEFHGKLPVAEFHRKFLEVDITLDPISVSGGTTTCESLWMGVPVIALASERFITRVSHSFLNTAGFADFSAASPKDYIRIAAHLADNLPLLAEIRAGLRAHLATTPLTDEVGFTRNLEKLYREIWGKWCKNEQPDGNGEALSAQTTHARAGGAVPAKLPRAGKIAASKSAKKSSAKSLPQAERDRLVSLFNAGRYAEAENQARLVCERYPDSGFAWKAFGASLHVQGKNALTALQKATELLPNDAEAHNNLAVTLNEIGQPAGALASCRRALAIKPHFAAAHFNLGNAERGLGRFNDAAANYRKALKIKPDYAEAHNNLGVTLNEIGQPDGAMASCRRALAIKPDFAEAHYNLGNAQRDLGRLNDAAASFRSAVRIKPDYAEAHSNLGVTLNEIGQPDGALASCRRALEIKPDFAEAHNNLGNILKDLGQFDGAEASFRRALEIKPDYAEAYNNLLFTLNYHPNMSGEEIFAAYREYDERFGLPHRSKWQPHGNNRETSRRLKVGYVSPDFRLHSCRQFLEPLLAHHDKNAVEVYAYAELAREDEVTARYKRYVDHWAPTMGMSDDALNARIRADGIDILVDLAGHTKGNRLSVFARKPAPVSLSWLGFGYTTGLSAVDYLLTDGTSAPEDCEALFSEKPWRLETPGFAYRPAEGMGQVSSLPALTRGYVTFGTLTRAVRINQHTIRVWSQILKRVEGSQLVIDSHNFQCAAMQDALAEKFAVHGIARERLEIGYHSPPWDVLRSLDIGLDCFPHNSGTTLFETLFMGVPFVTLAGRPSVGRLGGSVLEGVGIPSLIARTEDEYVETAVALASDLTRLAALRDGLRRQMETGPLMDEAGFARKVETAYREMWAAWSGGEPSGGNGEGALGGEKQLLKHEVTSKSLPQAERDQLISLFNAGRYAEAENQARLICERDQGSGFAWKALGASLHVQGKNALTALQKATELLPDDAEAHNNLAVTLNEIGQSAKALASCRRALAINPHFAAAHFNLGNAERDLGRFNDAAASYRNALKIKPDYAEAHNNLGVTLNEIGQPDGALASCRRALAIKPDFAEAHYNLGNAQRDLGLLDDAAASYRSAVRIKPDYAEAHNNLGSTLKDLGQFDDAIENFRHALKSKPDYVEAFHNLLFALNYHPDKSEEAIFAAYREYDERFGLPHRSTWQPHTNSRELPRRLKIGYVSPDFCRHSCRHFLEPLLAHHDKNAVEIYAYAELAREDEVTARYREYVDHWAPTVGMSDEALSTRIRADGIDILVDLAGHTKGNRLAVFARKPAPVSLSWLGFGYTTGLSAVDYLLTDGTSAPEGCEGLFSEKPWRLDAPGFAYRPAEGMGATTSLPALTRGTITFGTLTRAVRINQHTIRVWSQILKRVEGSQLVIDSHNFQSAAMQDALAEKFAAHGIARERLEIGCHSPPWDVLRSLDIGLDCFPHNSGTTLFETLYMGVPFVTLAGRPSVGRLGGSVLEGVGHPELIARTEEDYVEIAVALASDLPKLATLRAGLRKEMETGPLMDEAGFARKVEAAYREMFRKWVGE